MNEMLKIAGGMIRDGAIPTGCGTLALHTMGRVGTFPTGVALGRSGQVIWSMFAYNPIIGEGVAVDNYPHNDAFPTPGICGLHMAMQGF
jgi:hypothetical protein